MSIPRENIVEFESHLQDLMLRAIRDRIQRQFVQETERLARETESAEYQERSRIAREKREAWEKENPHLTVATLIEHLKTLDQEALVYRNDGDGYSEPMRALNFTTDDTEKGLVI